MRPSSRVDPGAPLLASAKGNVPNLYRVLGVALHLEPLSPADAGPLAEVMGLVHEWIGAELRWATNTTFPLIDPYRREDLDYVPAYADALRPPPPAADRGLRHVENVLFGATFGELSVLTSGGDGPTHASPYSFRFASEVHEEQPGEGLHTCAMLRVTVPTAWPLGDFFERACVIAGKLRVRWGAAGLTYAAWESAAFNEIRAAIYAHCRRHVGYDMGESLAYLEEWHREVRTVNWLTFLGADLAGRLRVAGSGLESQGAVRVSPLGETMLLRAGDRPEEGDINRLRIPEAYARADAMIRPVRAGSGIDFRSPWTAATSEQWLRRFEKRIH
jgi:Protein of unknown function (DUF3396)